MAKKLVKELVEHLDAVVGTFKFLGSNVDFAPQREVSKKAKQWLNQGTVERAEKCGRLRMILSFEEFYKQYVENLGRVVPEGGECEAVFDAVVKYFEEEIDDAEYFEEKYLAEAEKAEELQEEIQELKDKLKGIGV